MYVQCFFLYFARLLDFISKLKRDFFVLFFFSFFLPQFDRFLKIYNLITSVYAGKYKLSALCRHYFPPQNTKHRRFNQRLIFKLLFRSQQQGIFPTRRLHNALIIKWGVMRTYIEFN